MQDFLGKVIFKFYNQIVIEFRFILFGSLVEPKWISSKDLGRILQENGNPPRTLPENGNLAETRNFLLKHGINTQKSICMTPKSLFWFAFLEIRYWINPGSYVGRHQLWPTECWIWALNTEYGIVPSEDTAVCSSSILVVSFTSLVSWKSKLHFNAIFFVIRLNFHQKLRETPNILRLLWRLCEAFFSISGNGSNCTLNCGQQATSWNLLSNIAICLFWFCIR